MSKEKKIKRMQQQQAMQGAATPNSVLDAVKYNHQNQAQEIKVENKEEKIISQHIEQDTSKKTKSDMLISHNDAVKAAQNDAKTGAIDDTVKGEILPETLRTVTLVAGASQIVPLETVRNLNTCCQFTSRNIGIIAFSDGTGVGTVTRVSGNVIKLA